MKYVHQSLQVSMQQKHSFASQHSLASQQSCLSIYKWALKIQVNENTCYFYLNEWRHQTWTRLRPNIFNKKKFTDLKTDLNAWAISRRGELRQIAVKVVIREDCQPKKRLRFPIRAILISPEPLMVLPFTGFHMQSSYGKIKSCNDNLRPTSLSENITLRHHF